MMDHKHVLIEDPANADRFICAVACCPLRVDREGMAEVIRTGGEYRTGYASALRQASEGAPLMRCGCVATAKEGFRWVCVSHFGLTVDAVIVAIPPDLGDRTARCPYCKTEQPSSLSLPMFQYNHESETDTYYCGCRGWD